MTTGHSRPFDEALAGMRRQALVVPAIALLSLILGFSLRIRLLRIRFFDPDEFEHLHGAFSVFHGLLPYRDYFEHHTPWLPFLLQWIFPLWGESLATLFVGRAAMAVCVLGVLGMTFWLAVLVGGVEAGAVATVLLSFTNAFVITAIQIRPDSAATALWLGSLCCYIIGFRTGRLRWHLASGLALGAATMFTQKALFAAAGLALALIWPWIDRRGGMGTRVRLRSLGAVAVGALLPIGATLAYFAAHGALREFVVDNILLNARWRMHNSPTRWLVRYWRYDAYTAALGLAGLALSAARLRDVKTMQRGEFALVLSSAALLAGLFVNPDPYLQYFELFLPLLSVFAARLLVELLAAPSPSSRASLIVGTIALLAGTASGLALEGWPHAVKWGVAIAVTTVGWLLLAERPDVWQTWGAVAWLVGGVAAVIGCLLFPWTWVVWLTVSVGAAVLLRASPPQLALVSASALILARPAQRIVELGQHDNRSQLEQVAYILRHSESSDAIFDGWTGVGALRPHAYYYFFLHEGLRAMLTEREKGEDVITALEARRPKFVIYDDAVHALAPAVQAYVRAHYRPTGVGEIVERLR